MKLFGPSPRLIVANIASDAVMDLPSEDYMHRMEAGAPRKIWTLSEGDVLVTAVPVPEHMKHYACETLGLDPNTITCLTPTRQISPFLPENVMADEGIMRQLKQVIEARPTIEYYPFLLDRTARKLAQRLRLPLAFYDGLYADEPHIQNVVENVIYRLNVKSQFRKVMGELDIPVALGQVASNPDELLAVARQLLSEHDAIIIKRDRGSNGYGHTVVRADARDMQQQLENFARTMVAVPYLIEVFFSQHWAPSIEFVVTRNGPQLLYPCDQRCPNYAWIGMSIPPLDLPDSINREITAAAYRFGHYLHQAGYRGIYDIDGIAAKDGHWIVTETNLRTTGGTHMHVILTRLLGDDYLKHYWTLAESIPVRGTSFAQLMQAMQQDKIAFEPDKHKGVLITADGKLTDGKFRYILFAAEKAEVLRMESTLKNLL